VHVDIEVRDGFVGIVRVGPARTSGRDVEHLLDEL
jgi:hypothetical protein